MELWQILAPKWNLGQSLNASKNDPKIVILQGEANLTSWDRFGSVSVQFWSSFGTLLFHFGDHLGPFWLHRWPFHDYLTGISYGQFHMQFWYVCIIVQVIFPKRTWRVPVVSSPPERSHDGICCCVGFDIWSKFGIVFDTAGTFVLRFSSIEFGVGSLLCSFQMATSRLLCVRIEACADEVDLQVDLRWTWRKCVVNKEKSEDNAKVDLQVYFVGTRTATHQKK